MNKDDEITALLEQAKELLKRAQATPIIKLTTLNRKFSIIKAHSQLRS